MSAVEIIDPKTHPEHLRQAAIVKEIQRQLFVSKYKVMSWGAHAWKSILPLNGWGVKGATLQFKVEGRHFKGHVRIELNEGNDTYNVHFGRFGRQYANSKMWLNLETFTGIYCDTMAELIDHKVEYVPIYGDR